MRSGSRDEYLELLVKNKETIAVDTDTDFNQFIFDFSSTDISIGPDFELCYSVVTVLGTTTFLGTNAHSSIYTQPGHI